VRRLLVVLCCTLALSATADAAVPAITKAPIRTVAAGQGKIGYRSVGAGKPLVLIMGLSGTMDSWQPSFVDALAAHRRVITFDNEGIRRTTLGRGTLSIRRMADDTASLIRALKLRRADVLGWSMGGMIAQSLARRHPKLLRRLVLCATAPGDAKGTAPSGSVIGQLANPTGSQAALLGLIFPPGHEDAASAFVTGITSYPKATPTAPTEITKRQFSASTAWLLGQEPSGHPLSRLRLPVLVGGGELDQLLPVANQRRIAAKVPGAKLRIYPDAGHAFMFQHETEFVGEIETFLG